MTSTEIVFKIIEISVQTIVGLIGLIALTTWRRQIKYQHEFDAAKAMLKSLYDFEESVIQLRNSSTSSNELVNAYKYLNMELGEMYKDNSKDFYIRYHYRIKNTTNNKTILKNNSTECRIYWSDEFELLFNQFIEKTDKMIAQVEKYIQLDKTRNDDDLYHELRGHFVFNFKIEDQWIQDYTDFYKKKENIIEQVHQEISIIDKYNESLQILKSYLISRINKEKDWVDILFFRFNPLYK